MNLLSLPGDLATDAFQMSFSGHPDELGQWRGYAANGAGCSVATTAADVRRVADVAGWVIYRNNKQKAFARKILEKLRNERDVKVVTQFLIASASFMKDPGFEPEAEFRLLRFPDASDVQFRESGERLVPYMDFLGAPAIAPLPVRRIKIGPGWQLSRLESEEFVRHHVVQGIERVLTARGIRNAEIESSKIPYDPK